METYERLSGRELEACKKRWLATIGLDPQSLPGWPAVAR
jgi:hypothetical protein